LYSYFHSYPAPGKLTGQTLLLILTDDQGFADISYNPHHPPEVSTPNMDALAREGIFFTQAYITGNVCSPTRAGLMLGKYQQRVGVYTGGEGGSGFSLDEKIFPKYLQEAGYVSGAFGKWHLGLTPAFNPVNRGFDEFYGFMGRGAHDYYNLKDPEKPMYRNHEEIDDTGYLTDRLTEEAVDFIERHKSETFFLYLAYNAVHAPKQAPAEDIEKYDTGGPDRDILMAMLKHLDDGVGEVVKTLKEEGVWDNTLLFFLTDNGGSKAMHAVNTPLRAWKQWNYEGGIRTPWLMSWPVKYKGGRGMGWAAAGLTNAFQDLPEDHPKRQHLMDSYLKLMAGLESFQTPNGLWRQLIDYPSAWEETSGSAMFTYAMVTGIRLGWLDPEIYGPIVEKHG